MSLPLAYFGFTLVLPKGNYPGNVLKAQRYIPTKHKLHLQEDWLHKCFTTQVVSLNRCDLLQAVLVYMQEQKTALIKHDTFAWKLFLMVAPEILGILTGKKASSNKTLALSESMNMDI